MKPPSCRPIHRSHGTKSVRQASWHLAGPLGGIAVSANPAKCCFYHVFLVEWSGPYVVNSKSVHLPVNTALSHGSKNHGQALGVWADGQRSWQRRDCWGCEGLPLPGIWIPITARKPWFQRCSPIEDVHARPHHALDPALPNSTSGPCDFAQGPQQAQDSAVHLATRRIKS